jgi:hypothetical protein
MNAKRAEIAGLVEEITRRLADLGDVSRAVAAAGRLMANELEKTQNALIKLHVAAGDAFRGKEGEE